MDIRDWIRVLQARWRFVVGGVVAAVLAAVAFSLLTSPIYQATTRLFVSTSTGSSAADLYQGSRFSQERVVSYSKLLEGSALAERALRKVDGGDQTAAGLAANVTAVATPGTVLIDVKVADSSPERAQRLANALSDEFVVMARELETAEGGGEPAARVVVEQRATAPGVQIAPMTGRNVLVALVIGLLLGIAMAVLRDRLDNTLKDHAEVEKIVGASMVGTIPLEKERPAAPAIDFRTSNSRGAEAYRELRTNLQFLGVDNPARVIVVTSPLPGEGKTVTAINLSLVLAESGSSVVLIEGDLRRPRVAKYLGMVGEVGLSTVLSGKIELADALQQSRFENLTVLCSGALPPNPSELLGSSAARSLIGELRSMYDYVIIDASPLLPVTDGVVLTSIADGALVLARFGQTTREQLDRAIGNLRKSGGRVLGSVLTLTPIKARGGYEYGYSYEQDAPGGALAAAPAERKPVGGVPVRS